MVRVRVRGRVRVRSRVRVRVRVALGAEQAEVGLALRDRIDEVEHLAEYVSKLAD